MDWPYPEELVYGRDAAAAAGVPERMVRSWASRGRVRSFRGDGRPSGAGHFARTMYVLPDVLAAAADYRPVPQRARAG